MSYIRSFRTPKRPPKKGHMQGEATEEGPEAQKDTDKGNLVGGIGQVTPDPRSMREVPSIIRIDTATRHERGLSGGPQPHLERSSSSGTAEVAQISSPSISKKPAIRKVKRN